MKSLKIGDKVIFIEDCDDYKIGDIVTITSITYSGYQINNDNGYLFGFAWYDRWLRLIKNEQERLNLKYLKIK